MKGLCEAGPGNKPQTELSGDASPTLECFNIRRGESEPLSIQSIQFEAPMPVGFYSCRIICLIEWIKFIVSGN
jgi:hypothetical protein